MKTIVIAHDYTESNFAAMSYHLAHHLADVGFRIVFISHRPYFEKPEFVKKKLGEIHIYSWPTRKRPTSIKDLIWFSNLYLRFKPELIIGHFVGSNISVLITKLFSLGRSKTIVYYHTLTGANLVDGTNSFFYQKYLDFRKRVFYYLLVDLIICPSFMGKIDLKKNYKIDKSSIIPNPMLDRFKQKSILCKDKIVISFLGRLDVTKGVTEMVIAFEKYIKDFPDSKIILQIAGTGKLMNEILVLENKISNLNYIGGLKYEEVDAYLNKSHFTIIPSLFDNLPTVGLESLMNQTPLLISNSTGLTSYLTDSFDCYKFDPTIESIYNVFKRVEKQNEDVNEMGKNARELYKHFFNMSTYCSLMESQIINMIK